MKKMRSGGNGYAYALRAAIAALSVLLFAGAASADQGIIRMSSFPTISVADGRSTVTVTAEIRDKNGRIVPDGTQVLFSTSLGTFREPVVTTNNGIARAILIAGSIPGVAKVSATSMAYNTTSVLDYEFVGDRNQLSNAKEYIEVVAPKYLMYSTEDRILGAAGPDRSVSLRYREIEIDADDLQLNVPTYEVRARKARLSMGKVQALFDELYIKLNERRGFGTTTALAPVFNRIAMGKFSVGIVVEKPRYSVFAVSSAGLRVPTEPVLPQTFEFTDLSETATSINARKAVAFPRREIQFHNAEIYVGGARVMKLPLFQVSLYGQTPILTEQVVNVYDNRLTVNYPHYLSLRPGQTSLFRLRFGDHAGQGLTTSGGLFMDYEMNWNRGDDMEGGLVVGGLGRPDWGMGLRQYYRFDERTSANAQLDFPAHQSVFGSANISRQFNGFQMTLSGNSTRSMKEPNYENQFYGLVLEKDPTRFGNLPLRLYFGLTASQTSTKSDFYNVSQTAMGARARLQMNTIPIDGTSTVSASLLVSKLTGNNTLPGLSYLADVSVSKRFGANASAAVSYNFTEDGFTSTFLGRHSLSLQGHYGAGRMSLSAFGAKSIDVDRFNYYIDGAYRLSSLWRLSYVSTFNRYLGDSWLDDQWMLAYRLGARDVGIVWSNRTKRFGFQVLGAPID